jgi:hypothetical protein
MCQNSFFNNDHYTLDGINSDNFLYYFASNIISVKISFTLILFIIKLFFKPRKSIGIYDPDFDNHAFHKSKTLVSFLKISQLKKF